MRLAYFWGLSSLFVFGAAAYGCSAGSSSGAGAGGNTGGLGGTGGLDGSTGGSAGASATGGAGGTGATGGAAGAAGSGGSGGCTANTDCSPPTSKCDVPNSVCVQCLPTDDPCPTGQFCTSNNTCAAGCTEDGDCSGTKSKCDTTTNTCVECLTDPECPTGEICVQNACAQGCSATQPCANSAETCCNGSCHNVQNDVNFCGNCTTVCPTPLNAATVCNNGVCGMGACAVGFADCNKSSLDGCEVNSAVTQCVCTPSATQSCYTGPPNTVGKGLCKAGTQTCDASGLSYGPCVGQVVPSAEVCANGVDEDCNGVADDVADTDGDGWTKCNGDCCETASQCSAPALVNPGAFEFPGNSVDDDCDGTIDNPVQGCDTGLASNSGNAADYARAMDLCQTTTESPALNQKKWGVITPSASTAFYLANGAGSPFANARSIRTGFGSGVSPQLGGSIAVLSTGVAAAQTAPNNTNPAWLAFQGGVNQGLLFTSTVPSDWLAANGNNFPNAPGCPEPQGGTTANDPIMLKLRIRVPTNAKSFSVKTFFYSSEYPEWVCSAFNDFFLTLLDSTFVPGPGESPNPFDKNLAFYDPPPVGAPFYPIGVNLAHGNTGLFSACVNGPTGCGGGSVPGNMFTCTGIGQILGTGFDILNPPSQFGGEPGWCGTNNRAGGGTGWLTTSGNVKPGETIELRFVIWDTGDPWYDSLVLLDGFQWSVTASQPGTSG